MCECRTKTRESYLGLLLKSFTPPRSGSLTPRCTKSLAPTHTQLPSSPGLDANPGFPHPVAPPWLAGQGRCARTRFTGGGMVAGRVGALAPLPGTRPPRLGHRVPGRGWLSPRAVDGSGSRPGQGHSPLGPPSPPPIRGEGWEADPGGPIPGLPPRTGIQQEGESCWGGGDGGLVPASPPTSPPLRPPL